MAQRPSLPSGDPSTQRDPAPGMTAIASALANLYGYHVRPVHWGTQSPMRAGGEDPLDGVSAFPSPSGEHWHYVTYGLTELYEGEASFPFQPGVSGFGFELTFRLARLPGEDAPSWPVLMLQRLARYVFRSANVFRSGDHMALNAPMGDRPSAIEGALFTLDPELKPLDTARGEVRFLQVVGITADELEAVKDWRCEGFLELMSRRNPQLVTDLRRPSLMHDPVFAHACREGARQEGSSHGSSFASMVRWEETNRGLELTVGAIAVPDLLRALRLRLPFNRPFRLHGRRGSVRFVPGLSAGWAQEGRELVLHVPWDAAAALAEALAPRRGRYECHAFPGLKVVVRPTDVRGPRGELVRVIG